ncbi:MAG TPA: DUF6599 family protein, partial [Bryobacteraceae bacterium]|nr:DUF6599 family protein [Bryobacteraceae bacterium]
MSWRRGLILLPLLASALLRADDQALWREYGLVHSTTSQQATLKITSYQMKDPTGAMAAWEWIRSPKGHTCDLAGLCSQDGNRIVLSDFNYVLVLDGPKPSKAQAQALFAALPDKRESSWPAILTFIPQQDLVPNSTRYLLGPESLRAFVPELSSSKPGFDTGAEA